MRYFLKPLFLILFAIGIIQAQTARLQVIHNAADPAAAIVDIYLDGSILLDDFEFRAATPYIDAPAGTTINVGVAAGNSESAADTLKNFPLVLTEGETYVAFANGVLDPMSFEMNPDEASTAFTLFIKAMAREQATSDNVDFFVLHGATDAPTVDVIARGVTTLVNDAPYGAITDYISVPAASYTLDVTPGSDNNTIVASYTADLSGLGGGAAAVFASGFLSPDNDQNGEAFGIYAALPTGDVVAFTPLTTARLQVIHNAADPAAASVDVYLNGGILLDDFAFREATAYIDAPANQLINIGVAGGTSESAEDTLKNFSLNLLAGETYVAFANGVLDPMSFEMNPDEASTAFTLFIKAMAREQATSDNVDFFVLHGATDAPTVDVIARGVTTLVNDAPYGAITDYISVPAASYTLDVTPGSDNNTIVASYTADLSGLGGGAAAVFASGFLSPDNDQNGEAFGIYAALPTGDVVAFTPLTTARLQVIHNAADPAAASVDVYLNGGILLDDFAFREATAYIDAPANQLINIGVAGGTSESAEDTLKNFSLNLLAGETYVAFANGVLDPMSFEMNPDEASTAFTLFIKAMAREQATSDNVDFFVLHGATDAPTVDVIARGVTTLVNDAPYGAITDYISVPAASYTLDVTPGSDNNTIVASYTADLSGLGGGAAAVFASGFLSPDNDQNGEAFGIYAALPTGDVVAFTPLTTARLQVIHNAADPAAASVDVYLNGGILLDDFAFREATAYIDAPANQLINIGVAGGTSESAEDTLKNFSLNLLAGETYVAFANGVLDPMSFEMNPDEASTAFTLFIKAMAREQATSDNVDFFVLHGATDAPTVDVIARGVTTLVNDAPYGAITDYISVPAASYTLDVTPGSDNNTIVASYTADLSGLGGGAAAVFASGFLSPDNDQNGEAFGIYAALPTGDVVAFTPLTTARLQVIHNAADPAAASVDVYLNGGILLDDFAFREATAYIDAPANQLINIGVAGGTSESAEDTLKNFSLNLLAGETYVAFANGVLDPMSFEMNPDEASTAFTLFIKAMAREQATSDNVDFFVLHGATDAPTVDVIARGVTTLVNDAPYGAITDYISVPAASYTLDVTPGSDNNTVVASYTADLSGLGGGAAAVFASGFLSPDNDQNGEAFGIYAALPTGDVVAFTPLITSLGRFGEFAPAQFNLKQNYPNPFNPATNIEFNIPVNQQVKLTVFDITGRQVAELVNEDLAAGAYSFTFDAANLSSGIYFYRLQTQNFNQIRRMTLVK